MVCNVNISTGEYYAICSSYFHQTLYIFGSGFAASEDVTITICDRNCVLMQGVADLCGGFMVMANIDDLPGEQYTYLFDNYHGHVVSIKAWINVRIEDNKVASGTLVANWPLHLLVMID